MRKNSSSDDEFVDSQSISESNPESISLSDTDSSSNVSSDDQDIVSKKSKRLNKPKPKRKSTSNVNHSKKYRRFESDSDADIGSEPDYGSTSIPLTEEVDKIIGTNQPTFMINSPTVKFYVKFKNLSYIHCQWITTKQLCSTQRGIQIFNFFMRNPMPFRPVTFFSQVTHYESEDEQQLFKPTKIEYDIGYIIPEKVISMRINEYEDEDEKVEFLIKWVSLDYDESTWETDIPSNYIDEYKQRNSITHSPLYDSEENEGKRTFVQYTESPQYKNDHFLTDYQVEGLNWLQFCWLQKRNSILADEMGLGKTIESISILDALSKWYNSWGPFLIVCPLSTIPNWIDEFQGWTDFRVVCLMGNPESRKIIKENMIYHHVEDTDVIDKSEIIFDVLIVSYEWLSRELSFIKKFKFMYTIIDEAQRIKNEKSVIYKNCMAIQSYHKLLMTGTPIQNNMFEIWSLLHYISPLVFDSYKDFSDTFGCKDDPHEIERLQEVLKPYIFRRKKNDVNLELPEKEETIIEVEMTHMQRTISQLIIKDNVDILADLSSYKCNLRNVMMELRKLFCHPFLLPNLESLCISEYKEANQIPQDVPLSEDNEYDALINASGKTILIDKLLPKLKEGNHKVLIFSQMTKMLDIIEDYLVYKHYIYERIDGNCSNARRAMAIERFQSDDEIFVFLLSTRAGGLGINLTCADTVIIYDCDWNPQNDIQAQSRCHRIGQSRKVNVYRLITRGCYESEMFLRASKKLALDFAILDSDPSLMNLVNEENNDEDSNIDSRLALQMILRNGAYYTFNDDPNEIDKFCSENIDQILEHRSHTRKDIVSGGKSRFSKVSFDVQESEDEAGKRNFWNNLIESQSSKAIDGIDGVNENEMNLRYKTRKKSTQFSDYVEKPEKRKKKKKKKKKSSDDDDDSNSNIEESSNNDDDDDDESENESGGSGSGSSSSSYSSYSSYSYSYSNSDNEFVLSEKSEHEEEEDDNFEMIPDDDDFGSTKKNQQRSAKTFSPSPLQPNSLVVHPSSNSAPPPNQFQSATQAPTDLMAQLNSYMNRVVSPALKNNQKTASLNLQSGQIMAPYSNNLITMQQINTGNHAMNQQNMAYPNAQVNQQNMAYPNAQVNQQNMAYPNAQVNQNNAVYTSAMANKQNSAYPNTQVNNQNAAYPNTQVNKQNSAHLNIVVDKNIHVSPSNLPPKPPSNNRVAVLLKNPTTANSNSQLNTTSKQNNSSNTTQQKQNKESEQKEVIYVSDSSDYSTLDSSIAPPPVANSPSPPPKSNSFDNSDSYSNVDLSSSSSSSVSSPVPPPKHQQSPIIPPSPKPSSSSSSLFETCEKIIKVIKKYGIERSRFYLEKFDQEIARSLICIAFDRLPESHKNQYEFYINECIKSKGNSLKFAEFQDEKFVSSILKGDEMTVISCSLNWDILFKVALFVSNETLPKNYQFAPEISSPLGWTPVDDFVALTSSLFTENQSDIIKDDRLPFKSFAYHFPSMNEWLLLRIELIVKELSRFVPLNYNNVQLNLNDKKTIQEKIQNIDRFKSLNHHVLYSSVLNINTQKKILRILYLYGYPKTEGISKIKIILRDKFIDEKLILIFVAKILMKGMDYENGLYEVLDALPDIDKSLLNDDSFVNINWIKGEAIHAVVSNINLLFKVRENFDWFTSNLNAISIPEWTEIKAKFYWWNFEYDFILIKMTAYFGFFYNSVLCSHFPPCKSSNDKIQAWKTEEAWFLAPKIHQDFKFLEPICNFETKKKRINQMVNIIQKARFKENND